MSVTPLRSPSTISGLVGWFTGFSAEMNALNKLTRWRDLSGKGNHVESSAIRSGSINLSASATNENVYDSPSTPDAKLGVTPFPYLYGSTDAGLQFPTTMMTTTSSYTLFHVARYYKPGDAVPIRERIFDGVTSNWLSGFHGGKSGVAFHHNNWVTSYQTNIHGDTWVLSTDQRDMYRSNGTIRTLQGYSGGSSRQLSINHGATGEYSDWACAEVIVYDRQLTSTEYKAVEAYLNAKYFSTNLEISSSGPISTMSFATYLHDGTGYPISLQSLGSNLGLTPPIRFSNFTGKALIPRVSPVVVTTSDLPTQVFTIRGPSFETIPTIILVGVDGNDYDVQNTAYVSPGVATFTLGNLESEELEKQPFKVKIGSVTSIDTISSFISLPTRSLYKSLTYDLNNDLGVSPYTSSGTLPGGLSTIGGNLSGTLTTAGTYNFTITGTVTKPGGSWGQQAKIKAGDIGVYDWFGWSVAISSDGNTAIVGAYGEDAAGTNAGSAYIFTRTGTTWSQQAKINAGDMEQSDNFGWSVAISSDGNTAIVGARDEDPGNITRAGSAYIFTRSGGSWAQQTISAEDKEDTDLFGVSVAISGDGNTAIVGAYLEDPGGTGNAGSAYIFTPDSNGNWGQQAKISAEDKGVNDYFGRSVAISSDGNTAIVGAYLEDADGSLDAGSAYIFTRDSNGNWGQQAKINAEDIGVRDYFGWSVAISGDGNTAIVGAYQENADGYERAGSAYIFALPLLSRDYRMVVTG